MDTKAVERLAKALRVLREKGVYIYVGMEEAPATQCIRETTSFME